MSVVCVNMLQTCFPCKAKQASQSTCLDRTWCSSVLQKLGTGPWLVSTQATPVKDGLKHLPWSRWAGAQHILGC